MQPCSLTTGAAFNAAKALAPPRYRRDKLAQNAVVKNNTEALKQPKLGAAELLLVKTRDGFEMEAMMIKPPVSTATKYPVCLPTALHTRRQRRTLGEVPVTYGIN